MNNLRKRPLPWCHAALRSTPSPPPPRLVTLPHPRPSRARSAGTLDLERGVDDLIAAAASRASSATGSQPAAAAGLKLDLKLLDGGTTVELTGDVVVTTDGMAVTPSGMGFTPMNGPNSAALATGDDDWFATYGASAGGADRANVSASGASGTAGAGGTERSAQRPEDVAGLSPLLTPSNNKLCAALVDAF